MHRTQSPSRLPTESGAPRWQQRSSMATSVPSAVRYMRIGTPMMVRAKRPSPVTSFSQAATYQVFLMNMRASTCFSSVRA